MDPNRAVLGTLRVQRHQGAKIVDFLRLFNSRAKRGIWNWHLAHHHHHSTKVRRLQMHFFQDFVTQWGALLVSMVAQWDGLEVLRNTFVEGRAVT